MADRGGLMARFKGLLPGDADDWKLMAPMRLVEPETGVRYLARMRVVMTPWFGVFVHRLGTPDPGVDLHDHPFTFYSLILRGGYDEEYQAVTDALSEHQGSTRWVRTWRTGSVHRMDREHCHRITHLLRVPTWTMIFTGPRAGRTWGFYGPGGYTPEGEYKFADERPLDEEQAF